MILKLGYDCEISSEYKKIKNAEKLILPGVGSFDTGVKNLRKIDLVEILNEVVFDNKVPILGICLGAQLMLEMSEEGDLPGLSWLNGYSKSFKEEFSKKKIDLPTPSMGWNSIKSIKQNSFEVNENSRFYFVHSYFFKLKNLENELFKTNYGINYCSGFQKKNIYGVQFHPEKSHRYGFSLLKSFIENVKPVP